MRILGRYIYPVHSVVSAIHRLTDSSPRTWRGKPNKRIKYPQSEDPAEALKDWTFCNNVERDATYRLIELGMEERPLNAIERAHVVLMSAGIIDEEDVPWAPLDAPLDLAEEYEEARQEEDRLGRAEGLD